MPSRDLVHRINVQQTLPNSAIASNTTVNGNSVDTLGYESVTLLARVGARTDGTYTFVLQDSPDNSTWTALPNSQVIGGTNSTGALAAVGDALLGVNQCNRFIRVSVTSATVTTGATVQADIILSHPRHSGVGV